MTTGDDELWRTITDGLGQDVVVGPIGARDAGLTNSAYCKLPKGMVMARSDVNSTRVKLAGPHFHALLE
eukprot:4888358-Amphidinium_carterae.1